MMDYSALDSAGTEMPASVMGTTDGEIQPSLFTVLPLTDTNATQAASSGRRPARQPVSERPAPARPRLRSGPRISDRGRPASVLSNGALAELVHALPDLSLSFLVVETAREVRRRLEESGDGEAASPSLLRAAAIVMAELEKDGVAP